MCGEVSDVRSSVNVSYSMTKAVQPVDRKDGQVHDTHGIPEGSSFSKRVIINGHLQNTQMVEQGTAKPHG